MAAGTTSAHVRALVCFHGHGLQAALVVFKRGIQVVFVDGGQFERLVF